MKTKMSMMLAWLLAIAATWVVGAWVVAAPAQADYIDCGAWDGVWNVSTGTAPLILNVDGTTIRGHYAHAGDPTNGRVKGEARGPGCKLFEGTWRDSDGHGTFKVVLDSSQVHFDGWYKVCTHGDCDPTKYPWHGEHAQ